MASTFKKLDSDYTSTLASWGIYFSTCDPKQHFKSQIRQPQQLFLTAIVSNTMNASPTE